MNYKCLACEYRFSSTDLMPYCPACDNEMLEELEDGE